MAGPFPWNCFTGRPVYDDVIVHDAPGGCSMRNTKVTDGQADATAKVAAGSEKVHSAQ